MRIDVSNPLQLIPHVLQTTPDQVAIFPVFDPAHPNQSLVIKTSVKTRPIPPHVREKLVSAHGNGDGTPVPHEIETGRMLMIVPSDVARNMRRPANERDAMYVFLVSRAAYDVAASGIIVPANPPTRIIVP